MCWCDDWCDGLITGIPHIESFGICPLRLLTGRVMALETPRTRAHVVPVSETCVHTCVALHV